MQYPKKHYTHKEMITLCGAHKYKENVLITQVPSEVTCGNCQKIFYVYKNMPELAIPRNNGKILYDRFECEQPKD